MRRLSVILVLLGFGCSAETGFRNNVDGEAGQDGNGVMRVTPERLEYSDMELLNARSQDLLVESIGEENLIIYQIRVLKNADGVFTMEEKEDVELAPGGYRTFTVVAHLQDDEYAEGSVRIRSNDIDDQSVEIPLLAWVEGYEFDTGEPAEEDTGHSE